MSGGGCGRRLRTAEAIPWRARRTASAAAACLLVLLGAPSLAQTSGSAETSKSPPPLDGKTEASLREVARQINNPISPLWQLTFDNEIGALHRGGLDGEIAFASTLQPFMPVGLERLGLGRFAWSEDFRLITQLTMPFFATAPLPPGPGGGRKSGFADIQLVSVLAPSGTSGPLWGVGPTFIFPSASDDALGQGKWQAGPAVVAGYLGSKWTAYAVAQQWWSFAGDGDRSNTSQLCLEYVLLRNLPHRWQVGMQPSIEVDWKASGGNKLLFPVGLGVGKTVRIGNFPVQFWLEVDHYPVRPDDLSAPRWTVDFQIIPVIPALF